MSSFREDLRREDLRLVQRAIDAMPPQRRHVFILHRVHGRSIREIATETGLSAASIGQHLEAALLVLVRVIAKSENGQDGWSGQEAAVHHFVLRRGGPDDAGSGEHEAWIAADTGHAIAYGRVERAWEKAAALRMIRPAPDHDPDHDRASSASAAGLRGGGDQQ